MLKILKKEKNNIIVLIFIVGILSTIIYYSVHFSKGYNKNVELDVQSYNYNESDTKIDDIFIKLNSVIPFSDYIVNITSNEDDVMVISNNSSKTHINDIFISNIDMKKNKLETDTILSEKESIYYQDNGISPSKDILIYNMQNLFLYGNKIQFENKSTVYNLKEKKFNNIGFYFNVLAWLPDSSGFIGKSEKNLFFYEIATNKVENIQTLPNDIDIKKIEFSTDGTSIYTLLNNYDVSKNELYVYNFKTNKNSKISNINNIHNFQVIDSENIIVENICETEFNAYMYNINTYEKEKIKEIKEPIIYINEEKTKLISTSSNEEYENILNIYDLNIKNSKIELNLLGVIPEQKGILNLEIIGDDKVIYSISGNKDNESIIYIYDIIKNI